jgi:hypothetical protein
MPVYVVQARGRDDASLERASFIKDGFSWAAVVLGPFWLLYHRLWLALLVWIVVEAALFVALLPHVVPPVLGVIDLLAHLFLGLEGQRLRLAKAGRRARVAGVVEARDLAEAETRFFGDLIEGTAPLVETGPWGPRP